MTIEQIDRLVREANPYPDHGGVEPVGVPVLLEQRRAEMQTQQVEVDHVEEGRGRRLWIGIAAAIVVVVGALVLFQMTDDTEVVAPVDLANAYFAAYAAFDAEAVESMLAEGAEVLPWEYYEPRDWERDLRYLEAAGFELILEECRELPALTDGVRVNCFYAAHGLGSDRIGEGPFDGNVFRLVIADGLVVLSDMGFNFEEFAGTMWFPFQEWIEENHAEDWAQMYVSDSLSNQSDEAIALWGERVDGYVEYVSNPTVTTVPLAGAVPPELTGTWRGQHPDGEVVTLSLRGVRYTMSIAGPGGADFGGDVVIDGDTLTIPATPDSGQGSSPGSQCPIERRYNWSVEGDTLSLTEVVEDTCLTNGYLEGVEFTLFLP